MVCVARSWLAAVIVSLPMGVGTQVLDCGSELKVHQIEVGPMKNFAYMVANERTKRAVLVDAAWDIEKLRAYAAERQLDIVGGLYTHGHYDHVGRLGDAKNAAIAGAHELRGDSNTLKLWIGAGDVNEASKLTGIKRTGWEMLQDGDAVLPLDDDTEIVALDVPGHTPGHIALYIQSPLHTVDGACAGGILIPGDTLFVGACGRTDLPGGNQGHLLGSLSRLSHLPGSTTVLPGHDYGSARTSTIEAERQSNSFMRAALGRSPPKGLPPLPAKLHGHLPRSAQGEL